MKAIVVLGVLSLAALVKSHPFEGEDRLELFCGGVFIIPCPDTTEVIDRAGRLRFYNVPKTHCRVRLSTPSNCRTESAIYLHVPVSYLDDSQTVRIYESSDGNRTLVKQILGGQSYNRPNPEIASVAQVLSKFHRTPVLSIHMDIGPNRKENPYHEIWFDYTVVTKKLKGDEIYCAALGGFIPRFIMCDQPFGKSRVSCPEAYVARLDANSILGVQPCDDEPVVSEEVGEEFFSTTDTTPTTTTTTTTRKRSSRTTATRATRPKTSRPTFKRVSMTTAPVTVPPRTAPPPVPGPPQEVQHVSFIRSKGYGTVSYMLSRLPDEQQSYRIVLGSLVLHISDTNVFLDGEGASEYEEKILRTPAYSLIHPNCSQLMHWITFASRRTHMAPFIKFGYGYQMMNNVLFHFASKTNATHDQMIERIEKVVIADQVNILDTLKYRSDPLIMDTAPVIIPPDKRTNEHVFATDVAYLVVAGERLIGSILENVNAFGLSQEQLDAINYSLDTEGCTLHTILKGKQPLGGGSSQSSYIRIPGPPGYGAPGQEMVLEIWPPGHYSPVHNHGNTTAVIKVLQGSLKSEWYNPIVNVSFEKPVLVKSEMFYTGNITWMKSDMYQTHKLHNVDSKVTAITIQAYRYEADQTLVREDYFYYVKPNSPYLGQFYPTVDLEIGQIIRSTGKIIREFRTKQCGK